MVSRGPFETVLRGVIVAKKTLRPEKWIIVFLLCLCASAGYCTTVTSTFHVYAGPDDGFSSAAAFQDTAGLLFIGDGYVSSPYYMSAMRFSNVSVPRSALVISASLKIQSTDQYLRGRVYGQILSEASDDALDFSSRYIASAPLNSASVNWDHDSTWSANTWYTSPDISSVIQPVMNRTGWLRGNNLAIFYRTRANSNRRRAFVSFDSSPAAAPALELTYQFYKIWGHVTTTEGAPLEGVSFTVPHSDVEPTVSDANGYYELCVPPLWADTLHISKPGWYLYPYLIAFSETHSDWSDIDITASQPHISGYTRTAAGAAIPGVSVTADNGGGSGVTNSSGYFDIIVPYEWSGTVLVSKSGWHFNPVGVGYNNVTENIFVGTFEGFKPTISGYVTEADGTPHSGVLISTSDGSASAVTDDSGYYTLPIAYDWTGTITPAKAQWGFAPQDRSYVNVIVDRTNQNFTIFQPRISGTILSAEGEPIYNVAVEVDGWVKDYTDANGEYEFTVVYGWSGTVAPLMGIWLFEPVQRVYNNVTADQNDQDYTGHSVLISGYVTNRFGNPITGTITYHVSDDVYYFIADVQGHYEIRVPYNWFGTVTPSLNNFTFIPPNRTYTNVTSEIADQNYVAFQPVISGSISMLTGGPAAGVSVSAGGAGSTTTDANGLYEIEVPYGWSGTLTPDKTGLYFTPENRTYTNVTEDQNGQDFSAKTNPYGLGSGTAEDPYQIATPEALNGIGNHPEDFNKCFVMTADINLARFTDTQFNIIGGAVRFSGVFDGNGHSILNFNRTSSVSYVGIFGRVDGPNSIIKNLNLVRPNVSCDTARAGSLVGQINYGTIENCTAQDVSVSGANNYIGGLVGYNESGSIINCSTSGTVQGASYVGGLIGASGGQVNQCNSSCDVSASGEYIGGLVGQSYDVLQSCSTGTVRGNHRVGGLIGFNGRSIINCFSTADVNATGYYVGGLAGESREINDCYAMGAVKGNSHVGGLVGYCSEAIDRITRAYSTGYVTGSSYVGGLVGRKNSSATVNYAFWDIETSGRTTSAGGIGKTTSQMKTIFTYSGWSIQPPLWNIQDGLDYPHLLWEGLPGEIFPSHWYASGSGDINDPYIVSQPRHLIAIGYIPDDWDKYFRLDADIDCSGFEDQFQPIGNSETSFIGVFDGAGHTISNLSIDSQNPQYVGLFGFVQNAEITCLGLVDPNIRGNDRIGALVGDFGGGLLTQCWVRGGTVSGSQDVGGLVGYSSSSASIIRDCYAQADVFGERMVGGLVGINSGPVLYSYSTGLVTASQDVGGLIGIRFTDEPVSNCFWDVNTSGQATSAGGMGKTTQQMKDIDTFIGWSCYGGWTIDNGADYPRVACENAPGEPIDASLSDYLAGSGSADDPYEISDAAGLSLIGRFDCFWDRHFELTADIDMSEVPGNSYHIIGTQAKPFTGVFNGKNHSIYNFSCEIDDSFVGMFGCVSDVNARISNLKLVNSYIVAGSYYTGALAGSVEQGSILDCSVENGFVSADGFCVGGLVGRFYSNGDLVRCSAIAEVNGIGSVGGLIGSLEMNSVSDCYARGNVSGQHEVGGFAGRARFKNLSNCYSFSDVTADMYGAGGFIGIIMPSPDGFTITNCHTDSVVTAQDSAGGFAGRIQGAKRGRISNCTSNTQVSTSASGPAGAGGFAGFNDANLISCLVSGTVSGFDRVGGLCGTCIGSIDTSKFSGSVNGNNYVGGLVGYQDYTSALLPRITDSYCEGQVVGIADVGGLAGYNRAPISNSYSACAVSGSDMVGGLVGYPYGYMIFNCVWDAQISEVNVPFGSGSYDYTFTNRGRTTEQMKSPYSFAAWVCDPNWTIDNGKSSPRLPWENWPGTNIYDAIFEHGSGEPNDPVLIYKPQQLMALGWSDCILDKNFALDADLQLSDYDQSDFRPIGTGLYKGPSGRRCFTGTFDGRGHIIYDFNYRPAYKQENYSGSGLFCCLNDPNAQIMNIGLVRPDINGVLTYSQYCGPLVGYLNSGTISNCFSHDGNIAGIYGIGGLVGRLGSADAKVLDSYSTTNSFALSSYAGGLVGYNQNGVVQRCYSSGNVTAQSVKGGLVGGGAGNVSASFWDVNTSGLTTSAGGTGLTSEQMKTSFYFIDAGWDFNDVWQICETTNYPKFIWQILASDFLCPDGVDFIDFSFLASHWRQTEYGDCNGLELTGDGIINSVDFSVLAGLWRQGSCGSCSGADYSHDGKVDSDDLVIFCDNWLVDDYGPVGGAELTGDGNVNVDDLMFFAQQWLTAF